VYGKATGNTHDGRRKGTVRPRRKPDAWTRQPRLACVPVFRSRSCPLPGCAGWHQLYGVGLPLRRRIYPRTSLVDEAVLKAFDVYFKRGGFHMNLNVIERETLEEQ